MKTYINVLIALGAFGLLLAGVIGVTQNANEYHALRRQQIIEACNYSYSIATTPVDSWLVAQANVQKYWRQWATADTLWKYCDPQGQGRP